MRRRTVGAWGSSAFKGIGLKGGTLLPPRRCFSFSALAIAVCLVIPGAAQAMAFSYTGGEQTYTVPAGVLAVSVTAIGGPGGGPSGGLPGGRAAEVSGIVPVTPGEVLYVEVGGVARYPLAVSTAVVMERPGAG
jgi:hypothetical protein